MQHLIPNARIVTASETFIGSVVVDQGRVARIDGGVTSAPGAEDWEGDYLIAGLVELHTDNLEKHLEPRPGVRWPAVSALLTHDAQIATAGITTVLDAIDRKSTRLNSSHQIISYAVFCLKKKTTSKPA